MLKWCKCSSNFARKKGENHVRLGGKLPWMRGELRQLKSSKVRPSTRSDLCHLYIFCQSVYFKKLQRIHLLIAEHIINVRHLILQFNSVPVFDITHLFFSDFLTRVTFFNFFCFISLIFYYWKFIDSND